MRTQLFIACFLLMNGIAMHAYATHSNKPLNLNPIKAPMVIPAMPGALPATKSSTSSTAKSANPDTSFGYGGKSVDGSMIEKPDASGGMANASGSANASANPPAPGSSDPSMPATSGSNGSAPAAGASAGGGGNGTMLASSGPNTYYGNMDLMKDIKGFSKKEDLKTGVAEKFLDPQTRRPLGPGEIVTGKQVLMVTPDGRTIAGEIDVGRGQGLVLGAQNVKDPRFSYSQLVGASRDFIESRVFGFRPAQPTTEAAVGMKPSQVPYYAADPPTVAKMKAQGVKTEISLYALKWNPGDNSFDVIGGGGKGAQAKAKGKEGDPQVAKKGDTGNNKLGVAPARNT